jgi:O-antigen/teichoic acid export membrane protein
VASENKNADFITTAFWSVALFTFTTMLIVVAFREQLIQFLKIDRVAFLFLVIFSAILALKGIAEAILRGLQRFKNIARLEIINSIAIFVVFFGYIIITRDFSFRGYIGALCAGFFAYLVLALVHISLGDGKLRRAEFGKLAHFGSYSVLMGITAFGISNVNRIILSRYLGFSVLGLFAAYSSAAIFFSGKIGDLLSGVFFPTASGYEDFLAIKHKVVRTFRFIFLPIVVINFVVVSLLFVVYGANYKYDFLLALLFSIDATVMLFYQAMLHLSISSGVDGIRFALKVNIFISLFSVVVYYYLARIFGIWGAIGTSLAINCLFVWAYLARFNHLERKANAAVK